MHCRNVRAVLCFARGPCLDKNEAALQCCAFPVAMATDACCNRVPVEPSGASSGVARRGSRGWRPRSVPEVRPCRLLRRAIPPGRDSQSIAGGGSSLASPDFGSMTAPPTKSTTRSQGDCAGQKAGLAGRGLFAPALPSKAGSPRNPVLVPYWATERLACGRSGSTRTWRRTRRGGGRCRAANARSARWRCGRIVRTLEHHNVALTCKTCLSSTGTHTVC